jgi:hypothetical protein
VVDCSDTKAIARAMVLDNHRLVVKHCFSNIDGQISNASTTSHKAACIRHGGQGCQIDGSADMLFMGMTCQPVSTINHKRFEEGAVERHAEAHVYDKVIRLMTERTYKGACIEEVVGFGKTASNDGSMSELQKFVQKVKAIGCYQIKVMRLDSKVFIDFSRKRTASLHINVSKHLCFSRSLTYCTSDLTASATYFSRQNAVGHE